MNCPNCKSPIQENSTECEWCGCTIINELTVDYYKVLGVNQNSSYKEIKLAYRKKAIQYHPDRKNATSEDKVNFELCVRAFEIITNRNDNSDLDIELLNMLKKGQALNAVKYKKDNSSLNLKESKLYIENLAAQNGLANKAGGCFIATACYGDYESIEVKEFRIFRDNVMLKYYIGRLFVSIYYFISPPIANLISKSETAKKIIRIVFLTPILNLIRK